MVPTMEPAPSSHDQLIGLVTTMKDNFWMEHEQRGLGGGDIQQLWEQQFVAPLAPVLGMVKSSSSQNERAPRPPRTAPPSTQLAQAPFVQSHAMQRRRTELPRLPNHCHPNPRKRSNSSSTDGPLLDIRSADPRAWQEGRASFDSGTSSHKIQRTASGSRPLHPVSELRVFDDPSAFYENAPPSFVSISHARSPSTPNRTAPISFPSAVAGSPSLSSPMSTSLTRSMPLTPESAGLPSGPFTPAMSRQESLGGEFRNGFTMMRLDSQVSNLSDYPGASALSFPSETLKGLEVPGAAASDNGFLDPAPAMHSFELYSGPIEPPKAPVQLPIARSLPTPPAAPRRIEPKISLGQPPLPSTLPMSRISSEVGVPGKRQIAKTEYSRPAREKSTCTHCDPPRSFRGEHEVRRHYSLCHAPERQGWICVDKSEDGQLLSQCKQCNKTKVYGAYYNAAAHLRRKHFHPKKHGKKDHRSPSRAGKGGGDDPPMGEVKRWLKAVKVVNGVMSEWNAPDPLSAEASMDTTAGTSDSAPADDQDPLWSMSFEDADIFALEMSEI